MSTASSDITFSKVLVSLFVLVAVSYTGSLMKDLFFSPLSEYPGPKFPALSKVPGIYTTSGLIALHETYAPVVRVNHNELSFIGSREVWEVTHSVKKRNASSKPIRDPSYYAVTVNGYPDVVSADEGNHARQRKALPQCFNAKA